MIVSAVARHPHEAETRGEFALVHHAFADQIGVFGMVHDERVEIARIGEGAAHHLGVGHAPGAVREGDGAGGLEQADLGHFLAFEPLGEGCHRLHMHDRGVACAAQDEVDDRRIVDGGGGVGLAHDGGDAAGRGGLARRRNGLAVFGAGFADEGPHVDQAGRHQAALAVDDLGAFRHAGRADAALGLADHAIGDQQVAVDLEIARRVEDVGIGQQDRPIGHAVTHSAGSATALRAPPCAPPRPSRPARG